MSQPADPRPRGGAPGAVEAFDFQDVPVMQALLDIIPGTLHVKDRRLRYRVVNRYFLERWGLEPRDIIGKRTDEVFGDEHDAAVEARDRQVLETGEGIAFYEVEYPTKNGELLALWATKVPLLDADGTPTHVLTLALDISPLKQAERALNESEKVRSATVWRALDAIVAIDDSGAIIEFNPAAEQLFGYRREALLGQQVSETLVPHVHRGAHNAGMRRFTPGSLAARGGRRFETEALHADGHIIPIEIAVAEIALDGRSLFTAYMKDLRSRKAIEAELNDQREALHQRAKLSALGTLVASISHELKNPLSVVLGQTLLLQETSTDERVTERAERIGNAAERCASIVSNFLDMARQRPAAMVSIDAESLLDAALDLTRHLLASAGVRITRIRGGDLAPVHGDPHQLGQVLMNLIVNAEQAMAAVSQRRLELRTLTGERGGVRIEVSDSGPGLPADGTDHVFTTFFTTKHEGTGLGLAVCKDIVTAHGGHISGVNRPEGGATFSVWLPAADTEAARSADAPLGTDAPEGIRVLVLDDEAPVLDTLVEILTLGGYEVAPVSSAAAALERLRHQHFDAVLSDMRMPGMNGMEFFEALTTHDPLLAERFAFITGDMLTPTTRAFVERVGARTLEKPFTPNAVLELMRALLA